MLTSAEAAKSNATASSHPCYNGHKTRGRPSSVCYSLVFGQLGWPSGEKTLYATWCAVSTNNSYNTRFERLTAMNHLHVSASSSMLHQFRNSAAAGI